jgi:hypothetical protein
MMTLNAFPDLIDLEERTQQVSVPVVDGNSKEHEELREEQVWYLFNIPMHFSPSMISGLIMEMKNGDINALNNI